MSNESYDTSFYSWIDKNNEIMTIMSQEFPKPYKPFGGDINFKADLSNYATKADLKNEKGFETWNLKSHLVNLKAEVDKIDVKKLKTVPIDSC